MTSLKEHLFTNYDGTIRPVRDGITPTVITFRMLIYALLDMVSWVSWILLAIIRDFEKPLNLHFVPHFDNDLKG